MSTACSTCVCIEREAEKILRHREKKVAEGLRTKSLGKK